MVTDRDKMIENNIGLVHSIANRFKGRGVDYDDLFQSGCVGLIKAVDNFDESRGFAFSTYAVPVIMGEIKRIFRDGGAVKVSRSTLLTIVQNQAAAGLFFRADMFFTVIQSGLKRMLTSISKRALPLRLQAILMDISGQTSLSMTLKRRL